MPTVLVSRTRNNYMRLIWLLVQKYVHQINCLMTVHEKVSNSTFPQFHRADIHILLYGNGHFCAGLHFTGCCYSMDRIHREEPLHTDFETQHRWTLRVHHISYIELISKTK